MQLAFSTTKCLSRGHSWSIARAKFIVVQWCVRCAGSGVSLTQLSRLFSYTKLPVTYKLSRKPLGSCPFRLCCSSCYGLQQNSLPILLQTWVPAHQVNACASRKGSYIGTFIIAVSLYETTRDKVRRSWHNNLFLRRLQDRPQCHQFMMIVFVFKLS